MIYTIQKPPAIVTEYKTIYTGEGADVRCCGRVTGAVAEGNIATGPLAEKVMAAFDGADE